MADDPHWVEARAAVQLWDWRVGEERPVDANDPEIKSLFASRLLIPLDEEIAAALPPAPEPLTVGRGCNCG